MLYKLTVPLIFAFHLEHSRFKNRFNKGSAERDQLFRPLIRGLTLGLDRRHPQHLDGPYALAFSIQQI